MKQHSRDKRQWEAAQGELQAAKQAEISELETSALSLQSELGELRESMKVNAASMFSTAIDASVHSDAKISELEAVLCDMNKLCAARQSKTEELEPKLRASETLALSLQGELGELRESMKANAASMFSTAIDASVDSDATISELNELCAARQSKIEELEPKLQASGTLALSLQGKLDELRESMKANVASMLSSAIDESVVSHNALEEVEKKLANANEVILAKEARVQALEAELVSVSKTAATTKLQLSELQAQSARAALEHELQSTKYEAALEGAKEDLAQLQARTELDKAHMMASATES